MSRDHEIPEGSYKQFTLSTTGRVIRFWGNEVIEAQKDNGEWRIVNEKLYPRFVMRILEELFDRWGSVPVQKG